jgi:hypothetical protein
VKVKVSHKVSRRHTGGVEVCMYSFLTSVLDGVGCNRHPSTAFIQEKTPELGNSGGWVGGWTDVKKIKYPVFTRDRNPNHPAP